MVNLRVFYKDLTQSESEFIKKMSKVTSYLSQDDE